MAAPLNRQAAHLLSSSSSSSSSSSLGAEIAAESVLELRRSGVLQRLSKSEAPADATEVHRLLVRCDSLVGQDSRQGFVLARELLRALPWSHVSAHASKWVSSGIANLRYAPREIVGVLDILMGSASRDRPEYHRAVVAPNLASYAGAMLNVADSTQEPAVLLPLLGSLAAQVRLHPSSCRPLAPRIHKLCAVLLFDRGILVPQATKLLSALHLTGKGAAGAAELWSATMASVLAEARAAWAACSSTFVESQEWQAAANSTATTMMPPLPSDPLEALPIAQRRLGLLLGRPPMQGVLPCLLGEATSSPVPVPTGALYSLAHAILAVSPSSPPRQHPPVDASVHAAQVACLAGAHMSAINLLVALHLTVDRGVCSSRQADTVARLLAFVEGSHYSSAHRFVAFKALSMLGLPLDPQARLVLRASRACLAQISRLLLHTHTHAEQQQQQQQQQQQASASTSRPTKRAKRAYESDDLGLASQERRGLADVDGDERAACMAAMANLPALYGLLSTYLTPEHHDLAHTTALLLAAVAEVSMASDSATCAASLSALADVVALSRGSLLALLMARAGLQGATAACSPDAGLRAAGAKLRGALDAALHPRLPLRLDLKLQQDEALPASWTVSVGQQGEEDSLKLAKVEIEEQPGSNEATAMEQVLGIRLAPPSPSPHPPSPSQQQQLRTASAPSAPVSAAAAAAAPTTTTSSPSPAVTAATAAAIRERFSPDPVKPVRRPSTPRIGSPGASPDRKSNAASGATAAFMNSVARGGSGGGGQSGAGSPTSALTPKISSPLAAGRKLEPERAADEDAAMESAGGRRGGGAAADDVDDDDGDDDDDEAIPELDLGSSDEEDE